MSTHNNQKGPPIYFTTVLCAISHHVCADQFVNLISQILSIANRDGVFTFVGHYWRIGPVRPDLLVIYPHSWSDVNNMQYHLYCILLHVYTISDWCARRPLAARVESRKRDHFISNETRWPLPVVICTRITLFSSQIPPPGPLLRSRPKYC